MRRYPGRCSSWPSSELRGVAPSCDSRPVRTAGGSPYVNYDDFFADRVEADMVLVSTPENAHFDPAIKAIDAGYHLLLRKADCAAPGRNAVDCAARPERESGSECAMCCAIILILPKIRELVASGEFGRIVSVNHIASVGLDRATYMCVGFRRVREAKSHPAGQMLSRHRLPVVADPFALFRNFVVRIAAMVSGRNAPAGAGGGVSTVKSSPNAPFGARSLLCPPGLGWPVSMFPG